MIKLLYKHTDSFIYKIATDDLYQELKPLMNILDTNNYTQSRPLYSPLNKKVLGKVKVETGKIPIKSFIALHSKVNSYKCEDTTDKKLLKGLMHILGKIN